MASLFGFRTRSPSRDRETDDLRFTRLTRLIEQTTMEINAERQGLEKRYRDTSNDAGFLISAMENDDASPRSSAQLDELTSAILASERRLAVLALQGELMDELRRKVDQFLAQMREGGDNAPAGAPTRHAHPA